MNKLMVKSQTLSSLDVADMVEKEHSKLLRDIRRYSNQLAEAKIGLGDFWEESQYKDSNNQNRKCYLITKKGCEFIAHKTTGTKGTIFTARYINRFHEMENELSRKEPNNFQLDFSIKKRSHLPAIAKKSNWYNECKTMIEVICESYGIDRRTLYHRFLMYVSSDYDLELARAIYKRDRGYYPVYAMDIVDHFPELENELRDYIGTVYSYAIE